MVKFWLNNLPDLFSLENVQGNINQIKILNVISLVLILFFIKMYMSTKENKYLISLGLSLTVIAIIYYKKLIRYKVNNVNNNVNKVNESSYITSDAYSGNSIIKVNSPAFKQGDIVTMNETNHVVNKVIHDSSGGGYFLQLSSNLKQNYPAGTNVKNFNENESELPSSFTGVDSDYFEEQFINGQSIPNRFNQREDRDYEPARTNTMYRFQGPPNGPLRCRQSTESNPAGTIDIDEYDAPPRMYGTCVNDTETVNNNESMVSQRVNDLLFHKGNSQMTYLPVPGDTIPSNQEAFANWCYSADKLNPKYASIFVNDPDKFKMVSANAQATGTENGGGGGGGGRP